MPRDAYESDTSERDIPTCADILARRRVQPVVGFHVGGGKKALNRRGRAVARILHTHGWDDEAIAGVFGIGKATIMRHCTGPRWKQVHPRDEEANDYDYAALGGEDFSVHFPPLAVPIPVPRKKRGGKRKKVTAIVQPEVVAETDDEILTDSSELTPPPPTRTVKKPRIRTPTPTPEPQNKPLFPSALPPTLPIFLESTLELKGAMSLSRPKHLAAFNAAGLTVARAYIIAQWPDAQLNEALTRVLVRDVPAGVRPLDNFEVTMLEDRLRGLRASVSNNQTFTPPTLADALSIASFLTNVQGGCAG
ncbi:hypothetical protein MKEN_01169700 [Mycena kentingensis (nom. inval.)]|nr:hypothetical protein MKEN_01169700 [Mycena kentingensis (nom. inval.)]